jgi:hypothetical protein
VNSVDTLCSRVDGWGCDLAIFRKDVGQDLNAQENVIVQSYGEVGYRAIEMGMPMLWGHAPSLSKDTKTEKLSDGGEWLQQLWNPKSSLSLTELWQRSS